jgi:serine/threonine protein kinase
VLIADGKSLGLCFPTFTVRPDPSPLEIIQYLGSGAYTSVYEAKYRAKSVVVKQYAAGCEHRKNELAWLNKVTDLQQCIHLVAETDCGSLLVEPVCIPWSRDNMSQFTTDCAISLLQSLADLHTLNIVHRDVKFHNFFQSPSNPSTVLINDLGAAVPIGSTAPHGGTVRFASYGALGDLVSQSPHRWTAADDLCSAAFLIIHIFTRCELPDEPEHVGLSPESATRAKIVMRHWKDILQKYAFFLPLVKAACASGVVEMMEFLSHASACPPPKKPRLE